MGGIDKGLQHFLGIPLALHALQRLSPHVGRVAISANRNLAEYEAMEAPVWSAARRRILRSSPVMHHGFHSIWSTVSVKGCYNTMLMLRWRPPAIRTAQSRANRCSVCCGRACSSVSRRIFERGPVKSSAGSSNRPMPLSCSKTPAPSTPNQRPGIQFVPARGTWAIAAASTVRATRSSRSM